MYADALLEKIHALGGDYKSAYVRKINGYWKVQMGAFGVKDNAERMLKDLVSKGFNAFITTI
jgi:cell division septation protein DedD